MKLYSILTKYLVAGLILLLIQSCNGPDNKANSAEQITDTTVQANIFGQLLMLTDNAIPQGKRNDSLAFLILPVEASCPSCRKKTINSIVKHQGNLMPDHYMIISASGGRKTIRSYFLEQGKEIPDLDHALFLDSNNLASKYKLFKDNTVFYYSVNGKAYKKVHAVPATVRDDLQEFFSGHRSDNLTASINNR